VLKNTSRFLQIGRVFTLSADRVRLLSSELTSLHKKANFMTFFSLQANYAD
jgi:hypothetical protein